MFLTFQLITFLLTLSTTATTHPQNFLSIQKRFCLGADQLKSIFKEHLLQVVFVEELSDVSLQCRKCNESFNFNTTIHWFKTTRTRDEVKEEKLEFPLYKFSEVGSILFENVTSADSRIFVCHIANATRLGYDVKVFNPITYKNMTLARASMYINETRLVVNEVLQTLKMIKTVVDYHVTDWTKCFCRSSEKKMYAYYVCFVKIYLGRSEVFIYQCQSRELARDYPKLYEKVMTLKDVRAVKLCYDCLPLYHKPHKELRFKSLVFKEVVSGQPLKVPCVTKKGATDNEIRWVKDNSIYFDASFGSLGIGPVERHMGVDAVGELLISKVIKEDKGTYVCFVNGEPNVKLVLKILPQDVRETEEFKEGLIQLTFLFLGCILLWIPYGIYLYRQKS